MVKTILVDHNFGIQGPGLTITQGNRVYVYFQDFREINDKIRETDNDLLQLL